MSIRYIEPLEQSWGRMRRMLFRPFRLEFWMVLGFAAFLSNLGQGNGGASWTRPFHPARGGDGVLAWMHDALHTPWIVVAILVGFAVLMILGVLLAWVCARGRFVFLDDVLHERALIVEPWNRCGALGNSLFLFGLVVSLGLFGVFLILLGPPLFSIVSGIWADGSLPEVHWLGLVLRGLIAVPIFLAAAVFHVLTRHFVVPVMWKHGLRATAAWARFGPLLAHHAGAFVGYLLFLFVLSVGVGIAVVVLGFATCCVGFLVLIVPYLGTVVLLPVHVTLRGLGPEFLAQFGPEWDARPRPAEPGPVEGATPV